MSYEEAKKIVDLLIDTMILKEDDRNVTMDLLMNIDKWKQIGYYVITGGKNYVKIKKCNWSGKSK